jgi:DNA-binding LytR/AlgR family response regulator
MTENKHKCIIIDDDTYAIDGLTNYIKATPGLVLLKSYSDPLVALMELSSANPVDLILLDINMPNISGIELSKEIREKTIKLVFTTSYIQYGYEAFEANADAYLLKPYSLSKFAGTIKKLFPYSLPFEKADNRKKDSFFFVKNKNDNLKLVKISYSEIVAIESQQNYVLIYANNQKILTYMSLNEMKLSLNHDDCFIQVHRSFIVSKNHIIAVDGNTINMNNAIKITIGELYRKDFAAFITKNSLK